MTTIRLGLIGDNIAPSKAPLLHRLAGRAVGLSVQYDLLVPGSLGQTFDALFDACLAGGYHGVNVTYPYKAQAAERVEVTDPTIRAIAAVNTIVFDDAGPKGHNTDHSGFVAAYRATFGSAMPGRVCLVGAGGVGRAVGFALGVLGAAEIRIVERDAARGVALAADLRAMTPGLAVSATDDVTRATAGADGLINCTPVGMVGHAGTPLPAPLPSSATWAFDAVYTPMDTQFLRDAATAGLSVMSGYELFFHQGIKAFEIFTGRRPASSALRAALAKSLDLGTA